MAVKEKLNYSSIPEAADLLNVKLYELRQFIKIGFLPPPMRDLGGSRKYYSPSDIAEMQGVLNKEEA